MLNYKTSDLFRRAKQLADLEGSEFITWNEVINCLNESYIGLYQKLINMGDNSFVKTIRTGEKTIKLPKDFWQLKGIYLWNNGNLQTINRRAENNGIHHLSYELRNGEINLFGSPNDVQIEYYTKPITLTLPPNDCEAGLNLPQNAEVLAAYGHTFVYKTKDGDNNDIINVYDIDGVKNAVNIFENFTDSKLWITKNFVYTLYDGALIVYDLASGTSGSYSGAVPLVKENGDLFIIQDGFICEIVMNGESYDARTIQEFSLSDSGYYYICNDDCTDFYSLVQTTLNEVQIYHNGVTTGQNATRIIYAKESCYYLAMNKAGVINDDENKVIRFGIGSPVDYVSINENTGYGYCTKMFNKFFICPYCDDTVLDFPNSFYFQMLSYLLAISFRCKQGADITLLSSQLDMISQTFEDTLGSDSYQFPRMGNVYN